MTVAFLRGAPLAEATPETTAEALEETTAGALEEWTAAPAETTAAEAAATMAVEKRMLIIVVWLVKTGLLILSRFKL